MNKQKDKYQVICKYNDLFFDENERNHFDARNRDFWIKMNDLRMKYPQTEIIVERRIDNKKFPYLYETVVIHCNSREVQAIADQIHHQYYHILPLKFDDTVPEEHRKDIAQELLRNDLENA